MRIKKLQEFRLMRNMKKLKRERNLEKDKDEILKRLMEAKKENHKELDDLQAKLEDVQQAYTMDEIRFEEKYDDLLTRYQSERDTERKHYEELIHGKDGDQSELQKLLAEIRREYENVKRMHDNLDVKVNEINKNCK